MPHSYSRKAGAGKSIKNPEVMQAVIEDHQEGGFATQEEIARRVGTEASVVGRAKIVLLQAPDLIPEVLAGELSIYRAHEIATLGDRIPCVVCKGKGYVHRKRR